VAAGPLVALVGACAIPIDDSAGPVNPSP